MVITIRIITIIFIILLLLLLLIIIILVDSSCLHIDRWTKILLKIKISLRISRVILGNRFRAKEEGAGNLFWSKILSIIALLARRMGQGPIKQARNPVLKSNSNNNNYRRLDILRRNHLVLVLSRAIVRS